MSTAAPAALDRGAVPWLFASAALAAMPHAIHLPIWLTSATVAIVAWAAWLWWTGRRLPGRWILAALVAAGCASLIARYHTLLGRDAGVAMLFLLMGMKLLELRSRRDAYIVINLGYFLLLTHYLYSQGIVTGIWLLAAITLITATLVRLHGGAACRPLATLRHAGLMIAQALPFLVVLYLFVPRVAGPLWGLPQDAHTARSGLPDQISPGSIAQLALNTDIAFRVRFDGPLPSREALYWRGPVLEHYDGSTWRRDQASGPPAVVEALSPALQYELTLEPHGQRLLLALDAPTTQPTDGGLGSNLSASSRLPVNERLRYRMASAPDYRFNRQESAAVLERNTRLPAGNPQARGLAETWRRADPRPDALIRRALDYFRREGFTYTLQPPLLGRDPVDEFLFQTQRGFCEHYAAAFVVLMRAAGLPARVVGGYQGGEQNPVDGYLVVRQSDAHAWAEVWLSNRGWVRVDPTAAVSPERVESSLASGAAAPGVIPALLGGEGPWLRGLRYRWEALNNTWNQWVLGYNPQRQRELMNRLGLPDPDWPSMATLLVTACGSLLLMMTAWALYRRPAVDPALRLWRRALGCLHKKNVTCPPWEPPLALAERLRSERPDLAPIVARIAEAYCQARYGSGSGNLDALRRAIAQLP